MQNQQAPKPALPLLFLLALASLLGVVVAVALAGVAMLLAAPAYADEGRLLLERRHGLARAELHEALLQRLEIASHSAQARQAVLRRRQTSAIVEPMYRTPKLPALH